MRCVKPLFLAAVATCTMTACVSSAADPVIGSRESDPAVILANRKSADPGAFREGFLGERDDLIHYVEAGTGQTILFIHGFPSFWYVWFDQMEALRACRRVIAIDALGANLSAKPSARAPYRLENLADRLDEIIAELAPDEKITLVGHDWGGALAWSYAERDASRLEKLVVFSAPPQDLLIEMLANNPEQRARSGYMDRFRSITLEQIEMEATHESLFELAYRHMISRGVLDEEEGEAFRQAVSDPLAVNAGMEWYRANVPSFDQVDATQHSWPHPGASTDVPTLLVRGENDRTFVAEMGDLAAEHATQLKVETIPNVAHWTTFEDPDRATRLLAEFTGVPESCIAG